MPAASQWAHSIPNASTCFFTNASKPFSPPAGGGFAFPAEWPYLAVRCHQWADLDHVHPDRRDGESRSHSLPAGPRSAAGPDPRLRVGRGGGGRAAGAAVVRARLRGARRARSEGHPGHQDAGRGMARAASAGSRRDHGSLHVGRAGRRGNASPPTPEKRNFPARRPKSGRSSTRGSARPPRTAAATSRSGRFGTASPIFGSRAPPTDLCSRSATCFSITFPK